MRCVSAGPAVSPPCSELRNAISAFLSAVLRDRRDLHAADISKGLSVEDPDAHRG